MIKKQSVHIIQNTINYLWNFYYHKKKIVGKHTLSWWSPSLEALIGILSIKAPLIFFLFFLLFDCFFIIIEDYYFCQLDCKDKWISGKPADYCLSMFIRSVSNLLSCLQLLGPIFLLVNQIIFLSNPQLIWLQAASK